MIHPLPDTMSSAASARGLGRVCATARDGNHKVFRAAASTAVVAAVAWYLGLRDGTSVTWVVVAVLCSLVALGFVLVPFVLRGSLLAVHEGGFVRAVNGAAAETWDWTEIASVTARGTSRMGAGVPSSVAVVLGNGRKITVLDTCEGYVEFLAALAGQFEAGRLP